MALLWAPFINYLFCSNFIKPCFSVFLKNNTKHLVGKTRNNNNDTNGNITRYWRLIFPVDEK